MELITTYVVTGVNFTGTMKFKYCLKGILRGYESDFDLSKLQRDYLFENFPFEEKSMLIFSDKKKFTVIKGLPDIGFENFWNMYGLKVNREKSEKAYNKLSDGDKMKCFLALKKYNNHLINTKQAKAHLVTWINQKRFEDEY